MYEIKGRIVGVTPILFNRFHNPEESLGAGGKTKDIKSDRDRELRLKLHEDEDGLYLPAQCLKGAITGNAQRRGSATVVGSEYESKKGKLYGDWCRACLFIQPMRLRLRNAKGELAMEWDGIDGRVAINKKGNAIWVERPYLNAGWQTDFAATVVDDTAKPDWVRRFFNIAGVRIGVGSYRPEFGRFIVEWG